MNKILETLEAEREELADWRHDFHMHPELGLEETRTAGIVAQKLRSWGIEVTSHYGVFVAVLEIDRQGQNACLRS